MTKYQRIENGIVLQTAKFAEHPGAGWIAVPVPRGTISAAEFVRGLSKSSLRSLKNAVANNDSALKFYELMTLEGLNLDSTETQSDLDTMLTAGLITQAERDAL